MSTMGDTQYRGGFMSTVGDIMIHVGDITSTVGYSNNKRFSPTGLNTPHGTQDIPFLNLLMLLRL